MAKAYPRITRRPCGGIDRRRSRESPLPKTTSGGCTSMAKAYPGLPEGRAVVSTGGGAGARRGPNITSGGCTLMAKAYPRITSKPTSGLTWLLHDRPQGNWGLLPISERRSGKEDDCFTSRRSPAVSAGMATHNTDEGAGCSTGLLHILEQVPESP